MVQKQKVGFIGTGVMGKSMATHLIHSGYEVYIFTRTKEKAYSLLELGAIWCEQTLKLAQSCDIIFTMVGYPTDVEEIYFGKEGLLNFANPGTILIDMTTSSPSLAREIFKVAKEKGLHSLDAPVSGGDIGARDATLTIMVGGDLDVFEQVQPILKLLGENIILQGAAGAGQHTKMCNQIAIASNMIGVCEAVVYAQKSGLNPDSVLASISAGAAGSWSLSNLAPRIIQENFEPGFYIKHFIKDMKIALDEANRMELYMPGLTLAKSLYEQLSELGEDNSGTQALYKLWKIEV